jgi:hypothetical protein
MTTLIGWLVGHHHLAFLVTPGSAGNVANIMHRYCQIHHQMFANAAYKTGHVLYCYRKG